MWHIAKACSRPSSSQCMPWLPPYCQHSADLWLCRPALFLIQALQVLPCCGSLLDLDQHTHGHSEDTTS